MALYITKSAKNDNKDKKFRKMKNAYEEFIKNNHVWCIQVGFSNNYWFKSVKGDKEESVSAVINYRKNPKYRNAKQGDIFWSNESFYSDENLKEEPEYKKICQKIKKYTKLSRDTKKTNPEYSKYQKILEFLNKQFIDFANKKIKNRRIFHDIRTNEEFKLFCENKND